MARKKIRLAVEVLLLVFVCGLFRTTAFVLRLPAQRVDTWDTLASSTADSSASSTGYSVDVFYEGRSCQVHVRPNESLLDAMERGKVASQLAFPALPSDCRRGNCLTCTGRHSEGSQASNLKQEQDGLSPFMSQQVKDAGYVLTCSSFVVGEGVSVVLGANHQVWNDMYKGRLEDEQTKYIGRKAMARVVRRSNEANVEKWAIRTEETLKKTVE